MGGANGPRQLLAHEHNSFTTAPGTTLFTFDAPANIANAGGAAAGPIAYLADGREFIVNAFGGNVPDRSVTANGGCLGGGHTCDNPVGDAFIAFALPRRGDQ